MTDSSGVPEKSMNAVGQAISAVALVGALAVGFWAISDLSASDEADEPKAAACSGGAAEKGDKAAGRVYGAQLCKALNQRELATWLGTPGEIPKSASGSGDGSIGSGSDKIPYRAARIEFETYTVTLSATYDKLPVDEETVAFLGRDVHAQKVLRRPGVFYSTQTLGIRFRLGGSDAESTQGVPAEALVVAFDPKNRGGSYELVVWRNAGGYPDRTVLLDVAKHVLPVIPGFDSGGRTRASRHVSGRAFLVALPRVAARPGGARRRRLGLPQGAVRQLGGRHLPAAGPAAARAGQLVDEDTDAGRGDEHADAGQPGTGGQAPLVGAELGPGDLGKGAVSHGARMRGTGRGRMWSGYRAGAAVVVSGMRMSGSVRVVAVALVAAAALAGVGASGAWAAEPVPPGRSGTVVPPHERAAALGRLDRVYWDG
ncbi:MULTISPECIES: DUF6215 domain-containing protein [unclassified Streptomyces]|uniref:DUF6215 domain-containing protein n=1 Tax=unclassified Streptomyces TaxID=2593676 RepID=UPI000379BF26|nr:MULTISPECIES: DUF6215 domain-containing protein [unclassified Streptomyces]